MKSTSSNSDVFIAAYVVRTTDTVRDREHDGGDAEEYAADRRHQDQAAVGGKDMTAGFLAGPCRPAGAPPVHAQVGDDERLPLNAMIPSQVRMRPAISGSTR